MAKQSDSQQIATEQIAHRQRVHSLAVLRAKPTFEIDRPNVVGSGCHRQGRSRRLGTTTGSCTAAAHQPEPPQPLGDRSHPGRWGTWMLVAQSDVNLLCAPTLMPLPHSGDLFEPAPGSPCWRALGATRAIRQSRTALGSKTSQPFEAGLSADIKLTAELSNRLGAPDRRLNKALSRFQQTMNLPRHARRKFDMKLKYRHPCLCPLASPMSVPHAFSLLYRRLSVGRRGSRSGSLRCPETIQTLLHHNLPPVKSSATTKQPSPFSHSGL